jgi:hypothetical protein
VVRGLNLENNRTIKTNLELAAFFTEAKADNQRKRDLVLESMKNV